MATATGILQVSAAIQRRLQNQMSIMTLPPANIRVDSIDRFLSSPLPPPNVVIFLYNIQENALLKNRPDIVMQSGLGDAIVQPTPIVVDLDYMITTFTTTAEEEHQILGDVLRVLYDAPELDAAELNFGSTPPLPWAPDETVQLSLATMSIEDQTRIWTTFGFRHFKVALYYRAKTVPIRSDRVFNARIVAERNEPVDTFTPPLPGDLPMGAPLP